MLYLSPRQINFRKSEMRYKDGYKVQKRQELISISGKLAKKQGFYATGIDRFMKAAGVTSGSFYKHFSSKNDLFKALIETESERSIRMWWNNPHENIEDWIDFELDRYLSLSHVEQPENGCFLPSLANEIAQSDTEIRRLHQNELMRGHALFAKNLGSEEKAWAMMSQLVGAILIARSIEDENLRMVILESNKQMMKQSLKSAHTKN